MENVITAKNRRKRKFSSVLFLVFSILIVALILLTNIITYQRSSAAIIDETAKVRLNLLQQIGERTRVLKNSVTAVSERFSSDEYVKTAIESETNEANQQYLNDLYSYFSDVYNRLGFSFQCIVIAKNGFSYYGGLDDKGYSMDSIENELWFSKAVNKKTGLYWMGDIGGYKSNDGVLSAVKIFYNSLDEPIGLLVINIDERQLYRIYESALNDENTIYVIDEDGTFISHKELRYFMINYFDIKTLREILPVNSTRIIKKAGESIVYSNYYDYETGWTIVEEYPLDSLLAPIQWRLKDFLFFVLISVFCSIIIIFFMMKRFAKSLKAVYSSIRGVKDGKLDEIKEVDNYVEFRQIQESYNWLVRNVKRLLEEIVEKEKLKRESEISFLQAQISPHFVSNTLTSIKCMIALNQYEAAKQSMDAFKKLIDINFRNSNNFVLLEEEMEYLKNYITIQQKRSDKEFSVNFDLEEAAKEVKVPRFILQPILENAIFHGLSETDCESESEIVIEAHVKQRELVIIISDSGIGMSKNKIKDILQGAPTTDNKHSEDHIGILNVQRRIQLHYGERYGLEINSDVGQGTSVIIKLPVDYIDETEEKNNEDSFS